MSVQGTATAFVKSAFYKTCFCIGLGTASYYSYAQVQNWVSDKPTGAAHVSGSSLQDKVNNLVSFGSASGTTTSLQAVQANPEAMKGQNGNYHANPMGYLTLSEGEKKAEVPAAVVDPAAVPAPSASPGEAGAEKKEGEVKEADKDKKDGEKKDGEKKEGDAPKEGEVAQVAAVGPVNAIGQPIGPYAVQMPSAQNAEAHAATGAVNSDGSANAAAAAQAQAIQGYSGGIPTASTAYGATTAAAETGETTASHSSSTSGGSYTTSTTTTTFPNTSAGVLSTSDLNLLIKPIKAVFADQTESVVGLQCVLGIDTTKTTSCDRTNHVQVHTNRWSNTYGLQTDAGFVVRSTSGSTQVAVAIDFKFQDVNSNIKIVNLDAVPTEVSVHDESRNGKFYKVYEMKFADLTTSIGDKLTNVLATLVYEESNTLGGAAVMTSDSTLTFAHAHVQTMSTIWDTSATNRVPAANDQVIVADSIAYSITLEKSP